MRPAIREARSNARALLCNLRVRADRSTPHAAPVSRNSPIPGALEATTLERLRCVSFLGRRAAGWLLPPLRAHDRRPLLPQRDTRASCFPRCALAIRQAHGLSAAPLAPPVFPLPM